MLNIQWWHRQRNQHIIARLVTVRHIMQCDKQGITDGLVKQVFLALTKMRGKQTSVCGTFMVTTSKLPLLA